MTTWAALAGVVFVLAAASPATLAGPLDSTGGETGGIAEVRRLIDEGYYPQAEAAARTLLSTTEAAGSPDSPVAAEARDLLVEALIVNGEARKPTTRDLAEQAVAYRNELHGAGHLETVPSLTNLGIVLKMLEDFEAAGPLLRSSLEIREQALGPHHLDVAKSLNQLGSLNFRQRKYDIATVSFERALAILEVMPGPPHPEAAVSLHGIGASFAVQQRTAEAAAAMERAVAIREQSLGPDHPLLADALQVLAQIRRRAGQYEEAERLLRRALSINESRLGPDHINTGKKMNSLAVQLRAQGDYHEARQLYERALAIFRSELEPQDPMISGILNNLANLNWNTGDFITAEHYLEQALVMREQIYGPDHPAVAQSLSNLASVLNEVDRQREAIPLQRRAVEIYEHAYGPESVRYATSLNNLGETLRTSGALEEAEPLYQRAIAILEAAVGPESPQVAQPLNNLALLRFARGDLEAARLGFERALVIWETTLGSENQLVTKGLYNLARVVVDMGEVDHGVALALRAERSGRGRLRLTAPSLSEREALAFSFYLRVLLDLGLDLAERCTNCTAAVWDSLIRTRGLVLNELAWRRRSVAVADPDTAALLAKLKSASDRLAKLSVRGPGRDSPERYQEQLAAARNEVEELERSLGNATTAMRPEQLRSHVGFDQVAAALPADASLVGFAHCADFSDPVGTVKPRTRQYVALVLAPGSVEPRVVPLGPAREIDEMVRQWQDAAVAGDPGSEARYRLVGDTLRRHIWDPLTKHLGDPDTVFVVLDGSLNLVNLAALPVGETEYLVERGPLIHMLSEERELAEARRPGSVDVQPQLLAVGAPDFDATATQIARASTSDHADAQYRGLTSACDDLEGVHFNPLPATASEIARIVALWQRGDMGAAFSAEPHGRNASAIRLTGSEATEAEFKRLAPGKAVLHLATHGFVLGGSCRNGPVAGRGIGAIAPSQPQTAPPQESSTDPLRLSGLALAGANHRAAAAAGEEDGVLTAAEIVNLDLSSVDWAVLSACDSGLGESVSGEGVFGFRRAFRIAGARTVIMSLWPVEDESGLAWMEALYSGRLLSDMSTAEAVQHASLEQLRVRRERGLSTHPFYWGAFVAVGDWQ